MVSSPKPAAASRLAAASAPDRYELGARLREHRPDTVVAFAAFATFGGEASERRAKVLAALANSCHARGAHPIALRLFRQSLTMFESLGDKDPAGLKGRRRLSSMIFA